MLVAASNLGVEQVTVRSFCTQTWAWIIARGGREAGSVPVVNDDWERHVRQATEQATGQTRSRSW